MDTEKTINSLDHNFILAIFKKIGFGKKLVCPGLRCLSNSQESHVINGANATKFSLSNKVYARGTLSLTCSFCVWTFYLS